MNLPRHQGHVLICGQSDSGKTLLARALARSYGDAGYHSLVLDKFGEDWGSKAFVTGDAAQFLEWASASKRCALFIDEAKESASRLKENDAMELLATQGRHSGHVCHFIAQGPMMIRKDIRTQLRRWYVFHLARAESKNMLRVNGDPIYNETSALPAGYFYYIEPFKETKLLKVPGWIDAP